MQRRATLGPSDVESQRQDEEEALRPSRIKRRALCSCGKHTLFPSVATVFALWFAFAFCTSRCFLIDWSASTSLTAVPEVFSQAALDEHIAAHQPALLRGMLQSWPAVQKWTPSFFGRLLAHRRVEIYFWGQSGADWEKTRVFAVTLAQYAKMLSVHAERVTAHGVEAAGPGPYLQEDEYLFGENERTLLPDVRHFPYRPHRAGEWSVESETAFWMGPANARTGVHWDSVNALLHQVHGTKRVRLWPPGARSAMYPSDKYNHGAELSRVDAAAPDPQRFPDFVTAPSVTVDLPSGSALFVPAGWWHAVTSLDTTISVALRSQSACQRRSAVADDLLLWLHNRGWYKKGNCVCHASQENNDTPGPGDRDGAMADTGGAAGGGGGGGGSSSGGGGGRERLSPSVIELLRAADVDIEKAMADDLEEEEEEN
jgi:uncharacterized membrane protein YgcG